MAQPALEVADILRDHGPAWREANRGHVSLDQLKVMGAIERCRTAALGGHVARCENAACGHTEIAYNSSEGSSLSGASLAPQPCIRLGPCRTRTMKQPFASAARLRGGGPILDFGFEAMTVFGSPPPRIMISDLCANARKMPKLGVLSLLFDQMVQATAGRSATPTGISPIVASRQRAISSFRASATIIVLLRFPAASSVRPRYHCARALSF